MKIPKQGQWYRSAFFFVKSTVMQIIQSQYMIALTQITNTEFSHS